MQNNYNNHINNEKVMIYNRTFHDLSFYNYSNAIKAPVIKDNVMEYLDQQILINQDIFYNGYKIYYKQEYLVVLVLSEY